MLEREWLKMLTKILSKNSGRKYPGRNSKQNQSRPHEPRPLYVRQPHTDTVDVYSEDRLVYSFKGINLTRFPEGTQIWR